MKVFIGTSSFASFSKEPLKMLGRQHNSKYDISEKVKKVSTTYSDINVTNN